MKRLGFVLLLTFPLLVGTTYVITEGDMEVGRYEEPDGKDEVVTIQNPTSEKTGGKGMSASEERQAMKARELSIERVQEIIEEYSEKYGSSPNMVTLRKFKWVFQYLLFLALGLLAVLWIRRKLKD